MKYWVLEQILNKRLSKRQVEYLELDENFSILEVSQGVQRFAEYPNEVILGKDVRLGFPELKGVEDVLSAIITGQEEFWELKGITRSVKKNALLHIDIFITKDNYDNKCNGLIIFFEDVTEKALLEKKIFQRINENNLLLSELDAYRDYIHKIITSLVDTFIVTTKTGTIKTLNQAALDLFGYQSEELVNQPISMIISDGDFLLRLSQHHSVTDKPLCNIEVACKRKTGERIFVAFSCSAIQTEIEDLQDYVYIGRNITAYQQSQKRLAAQYATTRILSESGTLYEATPKILAAIGENLGWDIGELWTPDQQLGESIVKDKVADTTTVLRCVEIWSKQATGFPEFKAVAWQTTFTSGSGLPGRVWATRSSQWFTDIIDNVNALRTEVACLAGLETGLGFPILSDSEILGVMTFFSRDVEQPDKDLLQMMAAIGSQVGQFIKRKRAEAALYESEERYRDLFENASDLIQCVTPSGQFVYVNHAWRKTLGYSEAEIMNMSAFDIIHPESRSQYWEAFYLAMSGKKIEQVKCAFITKNGRVVSLEGNMDCKFVHGKPIATRAIFRDITQRLQAETALRYQQQKTESLLLNILPARIAERLRQEEMTIAEKFDDVTVLFADIVNFTPLASSLRPIELVNLLNQVFSAFDRLCERHSLEKIKTIGDAYMVVGGLPTVRADHVVAIAEMGLDMQAEIRRLSAERGKALTLRIGIHSGPVVAGVIGIKRFNYDLWGDTVNTASRMESHGLPGQIQVTRTIYERLREQYLFEERGPIPIKGKGPMTTYILIGRRY